MHTVRLQLNGCASALCAFSCCSSINFHFPAFEPVESLTYIHGILWRFSMGLENRTFYMLVIRQSALISFLDFVSPSFTWIVNRWLCVCARGCVCEWKLIRSKSRWKRCVNPITYSESRMRLNGIYSAVAACCCRVIEAAVREMPCSWSVCVCAMRRLCVNQGKLEKKWVFVQLNDANQLDK